MLIQKLNPKATEIFCKLISRLNAYLKTTDQCALKLFSDGFISLSMEFLYKGIKTPWGNDGRVYSLMHPFNQNSDVMRDPEMTFLVVDNREKDKGNFELVSIYPASFQQDNLRIYEESLVIEKHELLKSNKRLNAKHRVFADSWLTNIEQQGFLKKK